MNISLSLVLSRQCERPLTYTWPGVVCYTALYRPTIWSIGGYSATYTLALFTTLID